MKCKNSLTAVLLLAMLLGVVSCGDNTDSGTSKTASTTSNTADVVTEAVTEKQYKADYLPDSDFGGYVFRMVTVP